MEGIIVHNEKLTPLEYIKQLKLKLIEEANEVLESTNVENTLKEPADVLEVINTLANELNISMDSIESERLNKREINGYFIPDNYVHYIEVDAENEPVINYLKDKNRPYKFTPK